MGLSIPFARTLLTDAALAIPATAIPLGVTHAHIAYDVSLHVDPATKITAAFDLSLDGGATWMPWGLTQRVGGVGMNKDGSIATTSALDVDLFVNGPDGTPLPAYDPQNAQRRIRAQITTVGAVTIGPGSLDLTP